MSLVSEELIRGMSQLLGGIVSEKVFLDEHGLDLPSVKELASDLMESGLKEEDGEAVEYGLFLGHRFGFDSTHYECLESLAKVGWHSRHEDLIDALAAIGRPESARAIYFAATANFARNEYDGGIALGKKAAWALSKLPGDEGEVFLRKLTSDQREDVAECAQRLLKGVAD